MILDHCGSKNRFLSEPWDIYRKTKIFPLELSLFLLWKI
jgi:hypothetical protein